MLGFVRAYFIYIFLRAETLYNSLLLTLLTLLAAIMSKNGKKHKSGGTVKQIIPETLDLYKESLGIRAVRAKKPYFPLGRMAPGGCGAMLAYVFLSVFSQTSFDEISENRPTSIFFKIELGSSLPVKKKKGGPSEGPQGLKYDGFLKICFLKKSIKS